MEVYLVRHGETGGNIAHRHQQEDTPLSGKGQRQAREVAEQIKQLKPTHIVASNLIRAIETARIISEVCGLNLETNPRFIELVRPDHMYGHYHKSFKSFWFYLQWYLGRGTNITSGGESYSDFRMRLQDAKESISKYPKDARVVIVSHAVFISFFEAHLCNKRPVMPFKAIRIFYKLLTMSNTHITRLLYDKENGEGGCSWSLDKNK
ncbi:histidine phosphatase family protein [Candidatus Kaiserbacteria bacterium]|nr:histidine phosphatase family protein [Candidatus Kaiserbacteria bacterium]